MNKCDEGIVVKLRHGDEKALRLFYEEYFALFVAFANSLLLSEDECKDVVHDVFMKYWNDRGSFNDLISVRAFFYKSIRNSCLNIIRHQKVHDKFLAENIRYMESDDFLQEEIFKRETYHVIHREISKLTGMEQKVLLLALDGKSNDEIAEELGIAVSTVKSHKAKSYTELRKKLEYLKMLLFLVQ